MKGNPVNLNKARKEKARERSRGDADANAAKFGRSKEQKALQAKRAELLKKALDAHRREKPEAE
jgi:hypothetical protein